MTRNHGIWTRVLTMAIALGSGGLCFDCPAVAQDTLTPLEAAQTAAKASEMVVRVYPVADLTFTPPNYPYMERGAGVSGGTRASVPGMGGGGMMRGDMGGGGMMGGRGFGGGLDTGDMPLALVIQATIAGGSWAVSGGAGVITAYGDRLVISQTPEVHAEIQKLLNELRTAGAAQDTITVRAWWLRLEPTQYRALLDGMPVASPPVVNREHLNQLAADNANDSGEVTCFDGQTVHIVSGQFRNVITSVTPVVGELESHPSQPKQTTELAQADAPKAASIIRNAVFQKENLDDTAPITLVQLAGQEGMGGFSHAGSVGYAPQSTTQHSGAILEVTPRRIPQQDRVILDLRSTFDRWKDGDNVEFRGVVRLDQSTVVSQQLATTLKLPLGKPVLVGGMSLLPGAEADAKSQLYLVVEAIAGPNGD